MRTHIRYTPLLPSGSKYPVSKDCGSKNIEGRVFGIRVLKYWVLGPSRLRNSPRLHGDHRLGLQDLEAVEGQLDDVHGPQNQGPQYQRGFIGKC